MKLERIMTNCTISLIGMILGYQYILTSRYINMPNETIVAAILYGIGSGILIELVLVGYQKYKDLRIPYIIGIVVLLVYLSLTYFSLPIIINTSLLFITLTKDILLMHTYNKKLSKYKKNIINTINQDDQDR